MNAVFFHDARLKKCDDKYYTSGGLTYEYLKNYLKYFEKLTMCTREEPINTVTQNFSISSGKDVKFNGVKKLNIFSLIFGKDRKKIKQNIKNNDFAIIRMSSVLGIIASKECRKQKKGYLIEVVGCPWNSLWNYGTIKAKLLAPVFYLLDKRVIKKAKYVIYVTNEFLQKRYPTKGKYIGCSDVNLECNDDEIIEKRIKKIQAKKQEDIYKLGIIGNLNVGYKGHETAIKALSKIIENRNVELHFVGSGNKEKWESLAKKYLVEKNILFDGTIPHNKIFEWLDEMDIYLIPSLTEGMPRALIEAMSRGCPCIGTNVGGITELLSEEFLIKKKDHIELANKIEEFIQDKNLMLEQARKNFEESKNFEKNILQNKKEKFMKQMLSEYEEKK